jgi:TRAP transporter 4TM/12TM fusion protein
MGEVNDQGASNKGSEIAVKIVGIAMAVYHMVSSQYIFLGDIEQRNIHLGFALLLIFLTSLRGNIRIAKIWALLLAAFSAIAVIYVAVFYVDLEMRAMFNTTMDLIIGVILIVVVIEATRQAFGVVLPLVALFSVAYFFLGHFLPGFLRTAELLPSKVIPALSIGLTGIYGVALGVSASYIFLFVLFGSILQVSGATGFFIEVGKLVGRRIRSGPAMSAVVTSALVGTTTGSIGANIVTTGSFTIPLMKSVGYKPECAGAIEAAASNGGQIMPPVMGAAAFAMAGITGIPYLSIALAAAIPAIVYFGLVGLYAFLQAAKLGIRPRVETVNYREMFLRAPLFIVPLGLIIYLLFLGKPLMYCAFWASICAIALSLIRGSTRPSLKRWVDGFTQGAIAGAQIGAACACLGLILETMTGTGLGIKLPELVEAWSGGNMLVALMITSIASIILGMGVSTIGVYLLVAMVTAPILLRMGLGTLQAHFFVFFYAVFAMVTPPVGMGAILASKVAGARYLPTANEAVKASLGGFLLPFLIVWNPELVLESSGSPFWLVSFRLITCGILLIALETSFVGYYIRITQSWERIALCLSGLCLVAYFIEQNIMLSFVGSGIFVAITIEQLARLLSNKEDYVWSR